MMSDLSTKRGQLLSLRPFASSRHDSVDLLEHDAQEPTSIAAATPLAICTPARALLSLASRPLRLSTILGRPEAGRCAERHCTGPPTRARRGELSSPLLQLPPAKDHAPSRHHHPNPRPLIQEQSTSFAHQQDKRSSALYRLRATLATRPSSMRPTCSSARRRGSGGWRGDWRCWSR